MFHKKKTMKFNLTIINFCSKNLSNKYFFFNFILGF